MDDLLTLGTCTLPTAERPLRLAEFEDLFSTAVRGVTRDDGGVRLALSGKPCLTAQVQDLTSRESACCSFFTFTITGTDDNLTLLISVPLAQPDVLAALADWAQELSA